MSRYFAIAVVCTVSIGAASQLFGRTATAEAQSHSLTFTTQASITSAGGATASTPISVVVERFATDAERDALIAALKHGATAGARELLVMGDTLGTVLVGSRRTAIKYAYARATVDGRLITIVTAEPIVFVGAGIPGAKSTAGYDLGLVILSVAASGPGGGELAPATKLHVNDQGAIVTEDYNGELVELSNVAGQ
jgi:hypothetical protein